MTNTHMPFMAQHGDDVISLCCRKVNGFWKIHRMVNGEWIRLATRCPTDAIECSPTAEWRGDRWRITFIAGGSVENRLFRLYEYSDGEVSVLKEPAFVGFRNRKMLVYGGRERTFTVETCEGKIREVFESSNLNELFRLSYDPRLPFRMLISGRYNDGIISWIYDFSERQFYDVEADGEPAYKCAFFNGKCYYAKRVGNDFEDREVVVANKVKLTPLGGDILTRRKEN